MESVRNDILGTTNILMCFLLFIVVFIYVVIKGNFGKLELNLSLRKGCEMGKEGWRK